MEIKYSLVSLTDETRSEYTTIWHVDTIKSQYIPGKYILEVRAISSIDAEIRYDSVCINIIGLIKKELEPDKCLRGETYQVAAQAVDVDGNPISGKYWDNEEKKEMQVSALWKVQPESYKRGTRMVDFGEQAPCWFDDSGSASSLVLAGEGIFIHLVDFYLQPWCQYFIDYGKKDLALSNREVEFVSEANPLIFELKVGERLIFTDHDLNIEANWLIDVCSPSEPKDIYYEVLLDEPMQEMPETKTVLFRVKQAYPVENDNPEWVSVDIEFDGYNIDGNIARYRRCLDYSDPFFSGLLPCPSESESNQEYAIEASAADFTDPSNSGTFLDIMSDIYGGPLMDTSYRGLATCTPDILTCTPACSEYSDQLPAFFKGGGGVQAAELSINRNKIDSMLFAASPTDILYINGEHEEGSIYIGNGAEKQVKIQSIASSLNPYKLELLFLASSNSLRIAQGDDDEILPSGPQCEEGKESIKSDASIILGYRNSDASFCPEYQDHILNWYEEFILGMMGPVLIIPLPFLGFVTSDDNAINPYDYWDLISSGLLEGFSKIDNGYIVAWLFANYKEGRDIISDCGTPEEPFALHACAMENTSEGWKYWRLKRDVESGKYIVPDPILVSP